MSLLHRRVLACQFATCALIGTLALAAPASAEDADRYQKIRMPWPTDTQMDVLRQYPDLEPMRMQPDQAVVYLSRPEITQALRDAGFSITVEQDDLETFYRARANAQALESGRLPDPGFGDFYTWSEMVEELDALSAEFPDVITDKFSIGQTVEGREIWAIKISDNPYVDEDEPEVLFDAQHHAREPITTNVLLAFARFLGENHETDPQAAAVVNDREVWIVPMVNPDGIVYNESLDPAGGGMWRKNRRNNGGGCWGVDPNRNYSYEWGGSGSSGDPCNDIYRGPEPFSEPETSAIRDLVNSREFITHDSFHSVVGVILYPWGYTYDAAPDTDLFVEIGEERNRDSGYSVDQGSDLYPADGVTFDWSYAGDGHDPIISYTTEVGGSDFWPLDSEIPQLVAENLYSNIYLALVAGAYVTLEDIAVSGGDGNGRLDPGEAADLIANVRNAGVLAGAEGLELTLWSDDAWVVINDATATIGSVDAGGVADNAGDPFEVVVDPACPEGHVATFHLAMSWADGRNTEDAGLLVGEAAIIFADDFEGGPTTWFEDGSHTAGEGDWLVQDPNPTEFQPGEDTTPDPGVRCFFTAQNSSTGVNDVDSGTSSIQSANWDLSAYTSVTLALNWFHGQRDDGDDSEDGFRIQLSNDGGATFPVNLIELGDEYHSAVWTPLQLRLDDYLPLTGSMALRFQATDGTSGGDIIEAGFDDLVLVDNGDGNRAPASPVAVLPADDAQLPTGSAVELVVDNATDPEDDTLTYGFRVYSDATLTSVVRSVDGVSEGVDQTAWTVDAALPDGAYWWRAYASDGSERSLFTAARGFSLGDAVGVPDAGSVVQLLNAPAPNPFRSQTTLQFVLPVSGRVRVSVFDVSGRRVRSLHRGVMNAGPQQLSWDGVTESGVRATAGEYFIQVAVNGSVFTRKVVALN